MTIEEDLIDEIREIINTKTKNRKQILFLIIRDDETRPILKRYVEQKTPKQIAEELSMDQVRVEERMKYIDSMSRVIDSEISYITRKRFHDKQDGKIPRGGEVTTKRRKDSTRREFIEKYKRQYRSGKINSKQLEKDLPALKKLVDELNNIPRDSMFLAEVLVSLNKLEEAEGALNICLLHKNISASDRVVIEANRNNILKQRSKKMITDLFDQGLTGAEIANYIEEHWGKEYVRIIDRTFIYDTITKYYGSKKDEKNK